MRRTTLPIPNLTVRAPRVGTAILWRSCHLKLTEATDILRGFLRVASFDSKRAERPKVRSARTEFPGAAQVAMPEGGEEQGPACDAHHRLLCVR
jgi:hypothetical protein